MYTFALTLCGLIFIFGVAAIILDNVLDFIVFDRIEEDDTDAWYGAE